MMRQYSITGKTPHCISRIHHGVGKSWAESLLGTLGNYGSMVERNPIVFVIYKALPQNEQIIDEQQIHTR
jgi:hypothetical protein